MNGFRSYAPRRRRALVMLAPLACPAVAWTQPAPDRAPRLPAVGVFSLLGDSVRVVARETQEVLFKDVGMDAIAEAAAQVAVLARDPQAAIRLFRQPEEASVDEQRQIATAAALDGTLPEWMAQKARQAALSHVLLIASYRGAMEFHTALSQVVGNHQVSGVGFYVGAGRVKNLETGDWADGYLAPFVQLRVVLVEWASRKVVGSSSLSEGYIVGPPSATVTDPWRFLNRAQKAQALQDLLKRNLARGLEEALKAA